MNKKTRERLDNKRGNLPHKPVRIVESSDAPLLSEALLEKDKREVDIVEVNFMDQSAQIVEKSKAPKLTHKVLREKHAPIKDVELLFDSEAAVVKVRDGRTLALDIAEETLRETFRQRMEFATQAKHEAEDTEAPPDTEAKELATVDPEKRTQLIRDLNMAIKHLTISEMIVDPEFSYDGKGNGYPIEERSLMGVNMLFEAVCVVNMPAEDDIYQVEVLRATPIEASVMLQQGFELYPLGTLKKKNADLSDEEIEQIGASNREQRQILVSSLMPKLNLSFNGVGRKRAYPVENLSDRCLNTLHEAYKVVTIPEARLSALRRFQLLGNGDGTGADMDGESLSRDGRADDASGGDMP